MVVSVDSFWGKKAANIHSGLETLVTGEMVKLLGNSPSTDHEPLTGWGRENTLTALHCTLHV